MQMKSEMQLLNLREEKDLILAKLKAIDKFTGQSA